MEQSSRLNLPRPLTGNAIKIIAAAMMVFDHVHQMFNMNGVPDWFKWIGRPVMPLFVFLLAEGMHYTRNRMKYLLQLLVGYEAMLVASTWLQRLLPLEGVVLMNSIFGSLFLAALYVWLADNLRSAIRQHNGKGIIKNSALMLIPIVVSFAFFYIFSAYLAREMAGENPPEILLTITRYSVYIPTLFNVEAAFYTIPLAVGFFLLRDRKWLRLLPLVGLFLLNVFAGSIEWMAIFAAIPIMLYNGKKGGGYKYFFYVFYPAHIYILYILSRIVNGPPALM